MSGSGFMMSPPVASSYSLRRYSGRAVLIYLSTYWTSFVFQCCVRLGLTCLQRVKTVNKSTTTQTVVLSRMKEACLEHIPNAVSSFACLLVGRALSPHCGPILLAEVTGKGAGNLKGQKISLASLLCFSSSICFPTCVYTGFPSFNNPDVCSRKL